MTSTILEIIVILLFSAFFSGMETAFISSDKFRAELNRNDKRLSSRLLAVFYAHPNEFIATLLVGNYIALVVYGLLMADIIDSQLLSRLDTDLSRGWDIFLQTVISSLIILTTVEFIPKNAFKMAPDRMLRLCALPSYAAYLLFYPVAWLAGCLSRGLLRLLGLKVNRKESEQAFTKIDLDNLIQSSIDSAHDENQVTDEIKIFQNALLFSEVKVRDCMVPRTEIEAIETGASIESLKNRFIESGKSKIIVYKEDIDHIVGFIHSSEMFHCPDNWNTRIKETPVVPETMSAQKLLKIFMQQKRSLAIVVDEFGGTSGIVTMEDLVEEIFGDIEDEHDNTHYIAQKVGEHEYVLSGRLEVEKANELLGLDLPESEDYVTVSGLILHRYQSFPKLNEVIRFDHFEFKIIKNTTTKIELVRLKITG